MTSPTPEWCSWFSGLVDGEGCFIISRVRQRWTHARFVINMRADDAVMLEEIRRTMGFGAVQGRHRTYANPTRAFEVTNKRGLLALVRLFDRYPLRSRKRKDYEVWRTFVLLHQDRKNATDPRLEELFHEIRAVRVFRTEDM